MSDTDETDTIDRLAADLRALRVDAGNATLQALARRTGVSKSVLSDAFAGKKLPTERTVSAVVRELGGDEEAFVARRTALDPAPREPVGPPAPPLVPDPPRARTLRASTAAWLAVATGVCGLVLGAGGLALVRPAGAAAGSPAATRQAAPSTGNGARLVVTTGADPALTACVDDAVVAASETRPHDTLLEIVWSDACQAGWARVTRYDGRAAGNEVSASIFRQVAPDAPDRQDTTEPGVQGAYTTLLVRPTPDTRLCATGAITLDGRPVDLGAPLCL